MKRIYISALLMFFSVAGYCQQDVLISQYMFNPLLLNPAYAGSKDYMMATLLYRKQWVDFKGAPTTQIGTLHGPLGLSKFGWGVTLAHDKIGVTDRTEGFLSAAYQMKLSEKFKLGVGLRAGGAYYTYQNSDLIYWDANDPLFEGNQTNKFLPNAGAGAYLYSDKFYFGVSLPNAITYDTTKVLSVGMSGNVVPNQVRHYFFTTGYAFEINPDLVIKPSVLVKQCANAPLEADINVNVLLAQVLWLGVSYRTEDAIVALIELQLSKKFRLGYSYDFTTTNVKNYSSGSHEIMLGYDFGYDIMKVKTPRYF